MESRERESKKASENEAERRPRKAGSLYEALCRYRSSGMLPFHMPGHKRRGEKLNRELPYALDFTELEDTDDLHHPEGILKEAMQRTAELYRVRQSFYLINGSSCGNLAMIFAAVKEGETILVARNCHRSVFYALELRNLNCHFVMPEYNPYLRCFCGLTRAAVEREIQRMEKAGEAFPSALILTSPSYEGSISEIREISELCHRYGILVLVDEAHGAHLGFLKEDEIFPDSAVHQGADLVVQSPHKTLGSLTQSAWLHRITERVPLQAIRHYLSIFQSSSPSYPLMLSLDEVSNLLAGEGEQLLMSWKRRLRRFYLRCHSLQHLYVPGSDFLQSRGGKAQVLRSKEQAEESCFRGTEQRDYGKILISAGASFLPHFSGRRLHQILREEFRIEAEMSTERFVLLMSAMLDREEWYEKLTSALEDIDARFQQFFPGAEKAVDASVTETHAKEESTSIHAKRKPESFNLKENSRATAAEAFLPEDTEKDGYSGPYTIHDALQLPAVTVSAADAEHRILAEYVYVYPPGIPLGIPGQRITGKLLRRIRELHREKSRIQFSEHGESIDKIQVVKLES